MTLLTAEELQAIRDRSTFVPDGTVSAWMRYAAPAPEDRAALLAHIDAFSAPQGLTAADIITILRANPCAALEAVAQAKIARRWKATKDGPTRHDLRGFKLVRVRCEDDKAPVDTHYRRECWILVDE